MRKLINLTIICITLMLLIRPVSAMEFTAPDAPDDIQKYIPDDSMSFGEGLWFLVKSAIAKIRPELLSATETCLSLVAVSMLVYKNKRTDSEACYCSMYWLADVSLYKHIYSNRN